MVEVEMRGVDELVVKLNNLKYETRSKGGRYALRKAAQFVRDAARANARRLDDPESKEIIAENIVERWNSRLYKFTRDLGFRVGVIGGALPSATRAAMYSARSRRRRGVPTLESLGQIAGEGPGGDTFYWRFLEFGTEKQAARPFMRPALENNTQQATDVFVREYSKVIERAIKKAGKA